MRDLWTSPLGPAILLLVGAFLISVIPYLLRARFQIQTRAEAKSYIGLAITGLVFVVLVSRITFKLTSSFTDPPLVFIPWGTGDGLTIRLDGMSLAFLFIPVMLLLASFWGQQIADHAFLLGLAGAAAAVFVAANGISFSYALLLFDILGCLYWAKNQNFSLALARLFLSFLTTASLMLAALASTTTTGGMCLALALWLRIGLFPFVETSTRSEQDLPGGGMIWLALNTSVGLYVAARFLAVPPPLPVKVGAGAIILLTAWLAWLSEPEENGMRVKLQRMILVQPCLALLVFPLSARVSITLGLGYTLALGALWLTPRIGRPDFLERHWLWIYAAPILATLSLVGFPFTFGWVAHQGIYTGLLLDNQQIFLALVLLAEGVAFSALYQYWQHLLGGQDKRETALWTALILTIPFLLPGVAGIIFSVITGLEFAAPTAIQNQASATGVGAYLLLIWVLAFGFGYGRKFILTRLKLTPQVIEPMLNLNWTWPYLQQGSVVINQSFLRLRAIVEGGHYLGWAFLIALAGMLVVILS